MNENKLNELIEIAKKNDPTFLLRFKKLYPDFIYKLHELNPNLENSEIAFCAMVSLNFSSKEIANYLSIQHDSVQKRKSRIRKRLKISSEVDLYQFLSDLK